MGPTPSFSAFCMVTGGMTAQLCWHAEADAAADAHLRPAMGAIQHAPSTLLSSTFPRFRMLPWYRSLLAFATRLEVTCACVGSWYHGVIFLKPAGQRLASAGCKPDADSKKPIKTLVRTMFAWQAANKGGTSRLLQVLDVIASEYRTNSESLASQGSAIMSLLLAVSAAFRDQEWRTSCCTSRAHAPMRRGSSTGEGMCVPLPDSLRF